MRKLLILTAVVGCIALAGCEQPATESAEDTATEEAMPVEPQPTDTATAGEEAAEEGDDAAAEASDADESAPADAGESGGGNKI
jgi:hypothetical protein